jgi:hypothetical protein
MITAHSYGDTFYVVLHANFEHQGNKENEDLGTRSYGPGARVAIAKGATQG